jgi:hypothetical protein
MNNDNIITALIMVLVISTVVVLVPLIVIWSLNTLFPALAIAYNIQTWAATLILIWAARPSIDIKKS